jgi:hypothetical protein
VPEQLQESGIDPQTVPSSAADLPAPPNWLRLALVLEYLIALQVGLSVWTEVGGQGHMDLLPWYLKLSCIAALAWCIVHFTVELIRQAAVWTARTRFWFGGIVLMAVIMAGITLWYHLHEVSDEDTDETTAARSVLNSGHPRSFKWA